VLVTLAGPSFFECLVPFTVSHAAAVLPLHRLSKATLPLSALMIGSMAPDFAYFFSDTAERLITHSVTGLFTFSWPAGLIVWLMYVGLLEQPTIALLPAPWCRRFETTGRITFGLLVKVSIAIILGAATHILWDAFTHRSTPITEAFPILRMHVPGFGRMPLFHFLQGVTSVIGLVVLGVWLLRMRHAPDNPCPSPYLVSDRTRVGALAVLIATSIVFAIAYDVPHLRSRYDFQIFYLAIGFMSGWFIAWCAIALWMRTRRRVSIAAT
jgi:hypothetical protein